MREEAPVGRTHVRDCSILISVFMPMNRTKASALNELESGVLPVAPLTRAFAVASANENRISISRQQLPITPASYTFTDYRPGLRRGG